MGKIILAISKMDLIMSKKISVILEILKEKVEVLLMKERERLQIGMKDRATLKGDLKEHWQINQI